MENNQEQRFCEYCKKETLQEVIEEKMEFEYTCTICNSKEEIVKTFF
ncbi:hypothetical protein [Aquibacillus kalidii]|nr:hypothetical protein [Aquibacillus kalidii]